MNNQIKKIIIVGMFLMTMFLSFYWASAAEPAVSTQQSVKLENPLGTITQPAGLVGKAINGIIGIMGAVTLIMFVLGGFKWLTSAGNAERIKSGTNTMLWAAVGVVIVLSSYIIVQNWIGGITRGN
ncbi:MAG: hypothetical protein WCX97_04570 [Candidatus Magasanikbacteria bacterium]